MGKPERNGGNYSDIKITVLERNRLYHTRN